MSPQPFFWKTSLFALVALALLAGCAGQPGQKPIATAPKAPAAGASSGPIAQYPLPASIIYHAYLEIRVADVDRAAGLASEMANQLGGYLTNLNGWEMPTGRVTSIDLAVPSANFDALRLQVRKLGGVVKETITGEPAEPKPQTAPIYPSYSTITIQFQPNTATWPVQVESGWRPGRTFERAFGVFLSIFGFIADILIWIIVVLGPFVLLGAAVYWVVRRLKRAA